MDDFVFNRGKFAGKTYKWVSEKSPGYIEWVLRECPEMLTHKKRRKAKTVIPDYLIDDEDVIKKEFKPLKPNYNFDKEVNIKKYNMSEKDRAEIKNSVLKVKIGLFAKYSKETNSEGLPKYDKKWLIDIIFEKENEQDIKQKLLERL